MVYSSWFWLLDDHYPCSTYQCDKPLSRALVDELVNFKMEEVKQKTLENVKQTD